MPYCHIHWLSNLASHLTSISGLLLILLLGGIAYKGHFFLSSASAKKERERKRRIRITLIEQIFEGGDSVFAGCGRREVARYSSAVTFSKRPSCLMLSDIIMG